MRARPNLSGEQQVQIYLAKVATAARHLPKGARMAFVGRTKAQIERQVGAIGTSDPGRVAEVLAALGEPEELVRAERARIDSKWFTKRGMDADSAAAATATPSKPRVYGPRAHRPLKSRWKPAAPPQARKAAPGTDATADDAITGQVISKSPAPPSRPSPAPGSRASWPGDLDAMMPPGPAGGEDDPGSGRSPTPLDGIWQLARGHLLESVAVVLIGLGGALLPFPFWLAGALVAMFSRLWDGRDKVVALGGPVLVDLLGSVISAFLMGGGPNVVVVYTHALRAESGLWLRLGCALTAVYLGWRVSQGRRVKIPPWKR